MAEGSGSAAPSLKSCGKYVDEQGVPFRVPEARTGFVGVHQIDDDSLNLRDDGQPLAVKLPSGTRISGCAFALIWIHHM